MAKIRLPRTRPDIGISPIPRIAPTEDTPEAALAGGLYGLGNTLQAQAEKKRDTDFAEDLMEVSDFSTVLNEDGSLNYEETILVSRQLAANPKEGLAEILGDDRASRLASHPKFSVNSFRLQLTQRADKATADFSAQYLNGISELQGAFDYSEESYARLESMYSQADYLADLISDPTTMQNARSSLRPQMILNKLEVGARNKGIAAAANFYGKAIGGAFGYLETVDEEAMKEKLVKYAASATQAVLAGSSGPSGRTTTRGFPSGLPDPGTTNGAANKVDGWEDIEKEFLQNENLPLLVRSQLQNAIAADRTSKSSVAYQFSNDPTNREGHYGLMSDTDLAHGIAEFRKTLGTLTGAEQRAYLRGVVDKAYQSRHEVPEALKSELYGLTHDPATGMAAIKAFLSVNPTQLDAENPTQMKAIFDTDQLKKMRLFRVAYLGIQDKHRGLSPDQIFRAAQEMRAEADRITTEAEKHITDNDAFARDAYTDEGFVKGRKWLEEAFGEGLELTQQDRILFNSIKTDEYWKLVRDNPDIELTDGFFTWSDLGAEGIAGEYAAGALRDAGWMRVFNRLRPGFSREFLAEADALGTPTEDISDLAEGAIIRALGSMGYKSDEDQDLAVEHFRGFTFPMVESLVYPRIEVVDEEGKGTGRYKEDLSADPELKILVNVQTSDGNLLGVNELNKFATTGYTKTLGIYLTSDDLYSSYRPHLPDEVDRLGNPIPVSSYMKRLTREHIAGEASGHMDDEAILNLLKAISWKNLTEAGTGRTSLGYFRPWASIYDTTEWKQAQDELRLELADLTTSKDLLEWAKISMQNPRIYFGMKNTDAEIRKYRDWLHWGFKWTDWDPYDEPYKERSPFPLDTFVQRRARERRAANRKAFQGWDSEMVEE